MEFEQLNAPHFGCDSHDGISAGVLLGIQFETPLGLDGRTRD
ncbi:MULTISPECIES: hypothetical protein [Pseudomonas]|uniref:Uncharacterized protein n=1 Tax=Pseudomonas fluorescens TaxID=294 RepID=A0ACD4XYJ7_PSEFL|nr:MULTISPECIES: hypothetical protein [Pseudomonas]WQD74221.1 hypothetical protein U0037_09725 [Pseudomonas marginalis]